MGVETRPTLTEQFRDYENMWVAILEPESRIVGSGADPVEARTDAERKGHSEITLSQVPALDQMYVP